MGRVEMTAIGAAVLACGDCVPSHPAPEGEPVTVLLLIAALMALGGAILIWQRRHRARPRRVTDQWGALAAMGELCPDGWQAEITLHGEEATSPADAPPDAPVVALEWKLYEDRGERAAVARRVGAGTIGEALQMMVDDRRLDVTLEEVERSAEDRI